MKKYIISITREKGTVSIVRRAETKEEAMQKICAQYGWNPHITWLGDQDWSDGILSAHGKGYEFRILEVA